MEEEKLKLYRLSLLKSRLMIHKIIGEIDSYFVKFGGPLVPNPLATMLGAPYFGSSQQFYTNQLPGNHTFYF